MSSLRSAIDELTAIPAEDLSGEECDAELVEVNTAVVQLQARLLELTAAAERTRFFETLGYISGTAWLADRLRVTYGAARRLVGLARSLREMPATRQALADGLIDLPRVTRLTDAHALNPEAFAREKSI